MNLHSLLAALVIGVCAHSLCAQQIILFSNDFSAPNSTPVGNCAPDLDTTPVNDLWGGTGTGTGGGGLWAQVNTVETILLNGPGNIYTDSTGMGGDYCVGMLSTFQDDRAALTLDRDTLPFVNLTLDLSALDVLGCGGPFGVSQPSMRVVVYDTPSGIFDIFSPGTTLDEDTLFGLAPLDAFTLNWAAVATGLDVSQATNGNVTVMLDLLTSGYAVFDNIEITASVSGVGITEMRRPEVSYAWPNPAQDAIRITTPAGPFTWIIFDGRGGAVSQGRANAGEPLPVAGLSAGPYTLRWNTTAASGVVRFTKE